MRFCYVGHKFHKKTSSNQFFLNLLRTVGEVREFYSSPDEHESNDDKLIRELAVSEADCYVFWQTEYVAEKLLHAGLGRFLLAPMYDGAAGRHPNFWRQFLDAQFISFSRVHHEELQRAGCKTAYFRYFPEPAPLSYRFDEPLSAFFWERRPGQEPTFQSVVQICKQIGIDHLHVHAAPDMATTSAGRRNWPDEFELSGLRITVSKWFEDRAELDALIARSHCYFAPRSLEGIGMSFLEAMARGQIIVAPDAPTMNEYLRHGTTGLLYDLGNPDISDVSSPSQLAAMSRAAVRTVSVGHAQWKQDEDRLKSLILNDGHRWSTKDASSHFRNEIRRRASERVRGLI